MTTTNVLIRYEDIVAARERIQALGLPDPGSIRIAQANKFWEVHCPGQSQQVMAALGPFYACNGWFPLASATQDLESQAQAAVD